MGGRGGGNEANGANEANETQGVTGRKLRPDGANGPMNTGNTGKTESRFSAPGRGSGAPGVQGVAHFRTDLRLRQMHHTHHIGFGTFSRNG